VAGGDFIKRSLANCFAALGYGVLDAAMVETGADYLSKEVAQTMTLEDLLTQRDDILKIVDRHGAFNVRIFGSVARGEADLQSDVDVLVDYDRTRRSPWFPMGLIEELEALLGCRVDVVTEKGLKSRIRERVLQEAVPL
jgi:uncharacterized protein